MKIRSDFVSNSSSSSFVICKNKMFEFYKITKEDMINALIDLYGKDQYELYVRNQKKRREDPENSKYLSKAEKKYPNEVGPFYVYDLTDKDDLQKALELWGDMLDQWDSKYTYYNPNDKSYDHMYRHLRYDKYSSICHEIAQYYKLNQFDGIIKTKKDISNLSRYITTEEEQPNGLHGYDTKKGCKDIGKFLYNLRQDMGILTNKDIIKLNFSKFFIHFDDNEISNITGINITSKKDKPYENPDNDYEKNYNKEITESTYDSFPYSNERLIEILFNYFTKTKNIVDINNGEFRKFIGLTNDKSNNSNDESNETEEDLNYKDLMNCLLTGCIHEG